jgi:hypothetical protein
MKKGPKVEEMYTISMERPTPEKDGEGKYYQSNYEAAQKRSGANADAVIAAYGGFRSSKRFQVKRPGVASLRDINGIIIQHVKKTPIVKFETKKADGTVEKFDAVRDSDNPHSIETVTSGNVKFMWDEYFEIFIVKNGKSIDADSFQNGPLCTYEPGVAEEENEEVPDEAIIEDDLSDLSTFPYTYSKGTINVVGKSVFIRLPSLPPLRSNKDKEDANIKLLDHLVEPIKSLTAGGVTWSPSKATPANGLLFLPFDAAANAVISEQAQTPVFTHTTDISWQFPGEEKTEHFSNVVDTPPIPPPAAGGGSRKRKRPSRRRQTRRRN